MSKEIMQQALDVIKSEYSSGGTNKYSPYDVMAALEAELAKIEKEPMSFQTWRSRQHGDPEEIGFLQALKHAYESGQYSVSPPRKEWVSLSDDDLIDLPSFDYSEPQYIAERVFARAIEAKLKEKNTW